MGGGLSGCLIALSLAAKRPDLKLLIIDQGDTLGGNHVWSFFDSDVADAHRWLIEPLICHSWQGYDVIFPAYRRTLPDVYNSIESERLDQLVRERLAADSIVTGSVETITVKGPASLLTLVDGRTFIARHVVDARGPGDVAALQLGWQKFVGLSIHVAGGHGLTRPVVMDASVEQVDGYRFVYCLPFDAETVFIEDTYYSDTPDLDVSAIRERIIAYAAAHGWATNGGGREETGVLPVVRGGDFERYWQSTGDISAKAGLRAGLFHATTGYSLPDAVRLAAAFPDQLDKAASSTESLLAARRHWRRQGYYRLLGKMLFRAAEPQTRYRIFERFYRLSPGLIRRFYAGQSTWADKIRILSGKPPVPIGRAIAALLDLR